MKVKRKKSLNTQGFTLVELLVGMAVSLLALGAIYSTFLNQFKSYQIQEEVAAMQQNIRAAMFHMQREIRMAGCDPQGTADAGFFAASATSIHFKEDIRGNSTGSDPDGAIDDPNEDITYSLSDGNLVRNTGGGNQIVAENIDALNFVYLDANGSTTTTLADIRSVEITIVARTGRSLRASPNNMVYYNQRDEPILGAQNDNFSRKRLTAFINCRNLGLN
ncbi:MAG: prepilin-type N-terminal cleavage/methylation domain-containing protein [Desulfobacterales bacterium]